MRREAINFCSRCQVGLPSTVPDITHSTDIHVHVYKENGQLGWKYIRVQLPNNHHNLRILLVWDFYIILHARISTWW